MRYICECALRLLLGGSRAHCLSEDCITDKAGHVSYQQPLKHCMQSVPAFDQHACGHCVKMINSIVLCSWQQQASNARLFSNLWLMERPTNKTLKVGLRLSRTATQALLRTS